MSVQLSQLQTLAASINEAHKLTEENLGRTIHFAMEAGRMLVEAKAATPHGHWLPWLRENIKFSDRTAQGYMTLHRRWGRNPQRVADLPIRKALSEASHPLRMEAREQARLKAEDPAVMIFDELIGSNFETALRWFEEAFAAPFNARDLDIDEESPHWIRNKLFAKVGLPAVPSFFLETMDSYAPLPMLRLLDFDELSDAFAALAPIAGGETLPGIDTAGMGSHQLNALAGTIELVARRAFGMLITEYEYRKTITDEQFDSEWQETHRLFMSTVEARLEDIEEHRRKIDAGEYANNEAEGFKALEIAMNGGAA